MTAWHSRLPSLAILSVRGSKAGDFLQGQLSCDMRDINPARAGLGLHCNPSGRVIADLLVVQSDAEEYFLVTQRSQIDALRDTLARYAVFSRTQLEVALEWQLFGVQRAAQSDAEPLCVQRLDESSLECSYPHANTRLLITTEQDLPAELKAHSEERPESHWLALEWRSGIVHVVPPHSGQHTPQSLNYDQTGHVNFGKGCYTGQEVVARLHYRGKAKKRLALWRSAGPCTTGNTLFSRDGAPVAEIYASLPDSDSTWLWALISSDLNGEALRTAEGQTLEPIPLPFANQSIGG
jgi:folate-binding protein YgfZ